MTILDYSKERFLDLFSFR